MANEKRNLWICSHGHLNGKLIDENGYEFDINIPEFSSEDEANSYIESNGLNISIIGYDYESQSIFQF